MTDTAITTLAETFSYSQVRAAGLTKHRLYQLRDHGIIEQIERGLFRRADADIGNLDVAGLGSAQNPSRVISSRHIPAASSPMSNPASYGSSEGGKAEALAEPNS